MPKFDQLGKIIKSVTPDAVDLAKASELPMDEASRLARAKEMGFNTSETFYHGTDTAFPEFQKSDSGTYGPGVYLTKNADAASDWAGKFDRQHGQQVVPLHSNAKIFDYDNPEHIKLLPEAFQKLRDGKKSWQRLVKSDAQGQELAETVQKLGFGGFTDGGETIIFNPKNLRAKFAAFDPSKADSGNLSAFAPRDLSKENPLEVLDKVLGRPARNAAFAALSGGNPITEALSDRDTSGADVAREFLKRTEEAGMPVRAPGMEEYPLEAPLGFAADLMLDLSNLTPAPVLKGLKTAKHIIDSGNVNALIKGANAPISKLERAAQNAGSILEAATSGAKGVDMDDVVRAQQKLSREQDFAARRTDQAKRIFRELSKRKK